MNAPFSAFGQEIYWREIILERWPDDRGHEMEFRLVLRGALPPGNKGGVDEKHRIRQELHPQLRSLWKQHPLLKGRFVSEDGKPPLIEEHANEYAQFGFRFIPLVTLDAACALDILILRRADPYALFTGAGDLDGRVKTLLDGLRIPHQLSELGGNTPQEDEDPFFVLLQDDKVIYEINVTTDRLLVPAEPTEAERDIVAIIRVNTRTFSGSWMNIHDSGY